MYLALARNRELLGRRCTDLAGGRSAYVARAPVSSSSEFIRKGAGDQAVRPLEASRLVSPAGNRRH